MDGIANSKHDLTVEPGAESRFVLSDPTWPEWNESTPMQLFSPQIALRVPVFGDGKKVVVELNSSDTLFPQLAVGYVICCYYNDQMYRIASGSLRRK